MTEKTAKEIIRRNIDHFSFFFDTRDQFAMCVLFMIVGEITMASQLELITSHETGDAIDEIFHEFEILKED